MSLNELDLDFGGASWRGSRPDWTQAGWWDAELRPEVRELLSVELGPDLQDALLKIAAVDAAEGCDPGFCPFPHTVSTFNDRIGIPGTPCACQVVLVSAWNAVASWVAHRADQELIATVAARPVQFQLSPDRGDFGALTDPAVDEIAPGLRLSPGSAHHRVGGVRRVFAVSELRGAVASGLVTAFHAHLLVTDLRHLPEVDQARVIADVLQRHRERRDAGLRDWTVSDLRRTAKRVAAKLCLNLAEQRRECHRKRGVRLHLRGQGSATISADLADDDATRIFNRLTALAYGLDAETDGDNDGDGRRSLDQRRADLFTDLLLANPATGEPGGSPAPATVAGSEVAVVIDLPTLLRMADDPGDMPGCGPVAAEIARQLAADSKWRAWLTDTVGGHVIATSPSTYRPTAAVARLVRAREPYCRMPGCRAEVTDLDHVIPFPKGETTPQNLGPLCRRHHRMKTHSRWRILSNDDDPDGSWTWTTPTGITHTDSPQPPLD